MLLHLRINICFCCIQNYLYGKRYREDVPGSTWSCEVNLHSLHCLFLSERSFEQECRHFIQLEYWLTSPLIALHMPTMQQSGSADALLIYHARSECLLLASCIRHHSRPQTARSLSIGMLLLSVASEQFQCAVQSFSQILSLKSLLGLAPVKRGSRNRSRRLRAPAASLPLRLQLRESKTLSKFVKAAGLTIAQYIYIACKVLVENDYEW